MPLKASAWVRLSASCSGNQGEETREVRYRPLVMTLALAVAGATIPPRYARAQQPARPGETARSKQAADPRDQARDLRLSQAFKALYAGDPNRAQQLASAHLKQFPNSVRGLVLAARAHVARDEFPAAYDLLRKALALDPRNVDVLYFFGIVSRELATREFDRLYAVAPDGARVHQLMAESFKMQDKLAEAAAEYELALRASPDQPDALLGLADLRREESSCDEAVLLYQRAQAVKPTYEGSYGLGACLAMQNEHARAAEEFRGALTHDPRSAIAYFALGNSLLQSGNTTAALAPLERAVALEPRMRQAYYLLGRAYRAIGSLERSRQAFARADALAQAERSGERKVLGTDAAPRRAPRRPKRPQ
jgi:Tfp pilus assembly protein PilF